MFLSSRDCVTSAISIVFLLSARGTHKNIFNTHFGGAMEITGRHKLLRLMRQEKNAVHRIRNIASSLGQPLRATFNLGDLFSLSTNMLKKLVIELMKSRCSKITREEEEMEVLMIPTLEIWLAVMGPTSIDLSAFLSFCPVDLKYHYLKKAVTLISKSVPDLEELSLISEKGRDLTFIDCHADAELVEALGKLRNLKLLKIQEIFGFQFLDVIHLCENLPNLEFLDIVFYDDTEGPDYEELKIADRLRTAVPNLKVFLFQTQYGNPQKLTSFLAEQLLNLRIICQFADIFSDNCNYKSLREITCPTLKTSNLRHLTVDAQFTERCDIFPSAFPNITHLQILLCPEHHYFEEHHLLTLLQLTHLESLDFARVPKHILQLFLEKFGHNLRALKIKNYYDDPDLSLSFNNIFASCPRLERLALWANMVEDPVPISSFSQLREIQLQFIRQHNKINLSDILRAPGIERVTLSGIHLDFDDLKKVTSMIAEKKILRNLRSLRVIYDINNLQNFNSNHFNEISAFIKCAVAYLPVLSDVKLYVHYQFHSYTEIAKSLRDDKTENYEIVGTFSFFGDYDIDANIINLFVDEELINLLDRYDQSF